MQCPQSDGSWSFIESLPDIVYRYYLTPPRFEYISGATTRVLGYTPEEFYTNPALPYTLIHPDDLKILKQMKTKRELVQNPPQLRWRRQDGEYIWTEQQHTLIRDETGRVVGIEGMARDVTQRKHMEETLEQERNLLRTLVDHLPDMIYVKDTAGRFVLANQATAQVMGADTPQALLGKTDRDFYPPNVADEYVADEEHIIQTGQVIKDKVEPKVDLAGNRQDILTTKVPLHDRQGQVVGLVGISRDITERKRAESEREDLLHRAEAARAEAEAAVRIRDHFISVASHELKTPLTGLKGYAELLLKRAQGLDESSARMIRTIHRQSVRLEKMISALLDVSRVERGQLALEFAPVDLFTLMKSIIDDVRPTLRKHPVEFKSTGEPLMIQGDALRLEQVLQNLIQNAAKYSPMGGPITVGLSRTSGNAQIAVTDHGIGIPEQDLPKLFTRFHRAWNAEAFHINGLGVGLYVVREIIRLHGGDITVESKEGQGSTFKITLPVSL